MRNPFLKTAGVLFNYKRQLAVAFSGAAVSAVCFGGGITMILPVLQLLLQEKQALQELITNQLAGPDRPLAVQDFGNWLAAQVPTDPFYAFLAVVGIIMALTLISNVGRYIHELLTLTVVARAVMLWRARLFNRLIQAELVQLMVTSQADQISRVLADARLLGRGYHAVLGKALPKILNGIGALGVALWLDWRLSMIALISAPIGTSLLRTFGRKIRRASKRLLRQHGHMQAILHEVLAGLRIVKVHHAEGYERRRFARINRGLYAEEMSLRQVRAIAAPVIETLGLLGVLSVASIAAWYIFRRDIAPERFLTVLIALAGAASSLKPLSTLNNNLREAEAAASRILETVEIPIEPRPADAIEQGQMLPRHAREIVFDNVCFSYPEQSEPALSDVSLRAQFGQTVAIVGPNGCGKTTLLSLLPRLIVTGSGRIEIDGHDIANVRLRTLRAQIAMVTQQTVLFEGTIAQNIAYGRSHTSRADITAAAKAAYADDFVRRLPEGYDTALGENGEGLSGGQGQRLCIARAVLRDPSILILDEATSQVDADSEQKINQALKSLRAGRTTFVIAHRLSTVIDADLIVVMAGGRVVDQGTHNDLLARCETYQTLTRTQMSAAVPTVVTAPGTPALGS